MKKIVKLAVIIGAIAILAKVVADQRAKWEGLTEPELRDKLESRLPKWIPDEKRDEIADEIVSGMQERGSLRDDEEASVGASSENGTEGELDSDAAEVSEASDDITASV